jgi:capsular polysaccharide transport system permease protein
MSTPPSLPSLPEPPPVRPNRRIFATPRAIAALILREMSTTYGRSPGGYIWAILEPLGTIAVMSAVFSTGFRSPSLGSNFAIYYATGVMPFYAFLMPANAVTGAIKFSKNLLSYPAVTFIDAILARFLLNFLTQLLVSYIVLTALLTIFDTSNALEFDKLLLAYSMAAALGIGFGTLNCFLTSILPVWQQVWAMLSRPLVLLSGVIFLHERIPEPYRTWLEYNPLVHVVGESRAAFFPYYQAAYVDTTYVFLTSFIMLVFGLVFLRRYKYDILYY